MHGFKALPARYAASLWELAERPLARGLYMGEALEAPLKIGQRSTDVCLVAAHAVSHHREGRIKPADVYTGGLVRTLGLVTGASTMVAQTCDARLEPLSGSLSLLEERLLLWRQTNPRAVILDFHGARDNDQFDVALGTGEGDIAPEQFRLIANFAEAMAAKGLKLAINPEGYQAKTKQALTRRLREQGVASVIQIEIVRRCRQPGSLMGLKLCRALECVIAGMTRSSDYTLTAA